jgi:hypothetical protein
VRIEYLRLRLRHHAKDLAAGPGGGTVPGLNGRYGERSGGGGGETTSTDHHEPPWKDGQPARGLRSSVERNLHWKPSSDGMMAFRRGLTKRR